MLEDAVLRSTVAGVTTLTLNRAEHRNCLSVDLLESLVEKLTSAIDDPHTRVIVLTNSGNTFCAGADLKARDAGPSRISLVDLFEAMQASPTPIIGRVAGHCMGGGVGLAAACDISVASNDSSFGFTEVRLGVAPAIISVVCLPKMRYADAMELFLSGERISANRAAEVGLINRVVSIEDLDQSVSELTLKLTRGGPIALAAAKKLVVNVSADTRSDAFAWTAKLSAELFNSAEASEGISAFQERRDPAWVPKGS